MWIIRQRAKWRDTITSYATIQCLNSLKWSASLSAYYFTAEMSYKQHIVHEIQLTARKHTISLWNYTIKLQNALSLIFYMLRCLCTYLLLSILYLPREIHPASWRCLELYKQDAMRCDDIKTISKRKMLFLTF